MTQGHLEKNLHVYRANDHGFESVLNDQSILVQVAAKSRQLRDQNQVGILLDNYHNFKLILPSIMHEILLHNSTRHYFLEETNHAFNYACAH